MCGQRKEVTEFHKNSRSSDGLHSYCKECNKLKAKLFNNTEKGKLNVKRAVNRQTKKGYYKYGNGAINNMSISAKKRGIEFNLTERELKSWWLQVEDKCNYCGITIKEYRELRDFIQSYSGTNWKIKRFKKFFKQEAHSKINDMTIDRKDNSKGYEISNIVKACWFCNSLKSDFYTEEEMTKVGLIVMDNLKAYYKGRD
jgi:hypothetical protein